MTTSDAAAAPTHMSLSSGHSTKKVVDDNGTGYVAPTFEKKEAQMETVMDILENKQYIPSEFIADETKWFYTSLGIDDAYFKSETPEAIANQVQSLYAAKVAALSREDNKLEIRLDRESEEQAVYIDTSVPGVSNLDGPQYERRIDERYLNGSSPNKAYRVETFRSTPDPSGKQVPLRCYFVYKCDFVNPNPPKGETDLAVISDKSFLEKATEHTKKVYQEVVAGAAARAGPLIRLDDAPNREKRVIVAYKQGTAVGFFSALSDLYHYYGVTSARKYVEQFSNGITVMSLYLRPLPPQTRYPNPHRFPPIEASIHQITKEVSLLYCLPQNMFHEFFVKGDLSLQETIYAHCVTIFIGHFLNRLGAEYASLVSILDNNKPEHAEVLAKIKRRLRQETYTADYIREIVAGDTELIRSFYIAFANVHYVKKQNEQQDMAPTLSFERLQIGRLLSEDELKVELVKKVKNPQHRMVMERFLDFNKHVLKTNFYTPTKVALSFRMSAEFLSRSEYPQPLYGFFLTIGSEFRGFHLRFKDVARGGIRIVKSRNKEQWRINSRSLFDENYNLANTQQRKNKDIPEGGSKGVILLDHDQQDKQTIAFEKYIDSLLDLLLPATSPGIKDPIVDLHGKEEILFMGPDENTAGLVDWATQHAKLRGAPWWKAFFTGKSQSLGGIPHDKYGMTTMSVREYVKGIYRKMGVDETKMRKLQTGGPDGDLGSNEILNGNETYIAIVDGSGVICDPHGLDRDELVRLAKARKMVSNFDRSKLSKDGYLVLVDENDITLPSGEQVPSGTDFRNSYHLRSDNNYDVFVPCGGRPEAIDLTNVRSLIDENGISRIRFIVEGANLFITQDAKVRLEKANAILYKDASANKGGVTSSSMEVLASLCFDDEAFQEHMCLRNGKVPEFYEAYVRAVQDKIRENARLEFEAIWREAEKTKGAARSLLSDDISNAIVALDEQLQNGTLYENLALRKSVLSQALPKLLIDKIGLDKIMERIPDMYQRAIFGSYLASRFIYEYGHQVSHVTFFDFMVKKLGEVEKA